MFDYILNIFRQRKLKRHLNNVQTSFIPLSDITNVNVVIDVEEPDFDLLKEDIIAWGKKFGLKVNIYFFDFRILGKGELLLTSIQTTIIRKELDWLGTPDFAKVGPLIYEPSDLLISMVNNGNYPIEFISKCAKARFKIGRFGFEGHAYDMVVTCNHIESYKSEPCQVFAAITDFLEKVR